MSNVTVTGTYGEGESLHAEDAAACREMDQARGVPAGDPESEVAMRRFRNILHSHACPICGACAAQFSRFPHACRLPKAAGATVLNLGGNPAGGTVLAHLKLQCWFCAHLPFYPPWIAAKERRADLVSAKRR